MKSYSTFIVELNDGSTHAAVTAGLKELLQTVQSTGRSGALTVKMKVAPAVKGSTGSVDKVTVTVEHKLELPKPEQPTDFFWLTDDGETTRHHPRQQSLELRAVESPAPLTFKEAV